jgi:hypothetical protein
MERERECFGVVAAADAVVNDGVGLTRSKERCKIEPFSVQP